MPELPGIVREIGSFKVTAEYLGEINQLLSIGKISRICLPSEHLSDKKAAPSAFVTDGVLA